MTLVFTKGETAKSWSHLTWFVWRGVCSMGAFLLSAGTKGVTLPFVVISLDSSICIGIIGSRVRNALDRPKLQS